MFKWKAYVPELEKEFYVYSSTFNDKEIYFSIAKNICAYSLSDLNDNLPIRNKVLAFSFNEKIIEEIDTGKYIIKKKLIWSDYDSNKIEMKSCYSYSGGYIGDEKTADFICNKMGIVPETIPGDEVCSIGYCRMNNKWYGWSHRAIVGFQKGNRIFEERYGNGNTPFIEHGSKTIKSLDDAKQAAINFARYIG